jgi:hypothetical protein
MANRHQRRKRAMLKAAYYAQLTDDQRRSLEVSEIVKRNLASPKPERSFAPSSVALVQQSNLGSSKAGKRRVAPYSKHSAGDTPTPANYPLDKRLSEMGDRRLVTERINDRRFDSPAVNYPIVDRD